MADADYMSPAAAHATTMHLSGALTIGFLYDTELNFGEDEERPPDEERQARGPRGR